MKKFICILFVLLEVNFYGRAAPIFPKKHQKDIFYDTDTVLYPYLYLKNEELRAYGVDETKNMGVELSYPLKFQHSGKILAYTNRRGRVIINDTEILVKPTEFDALIDPKNPFFKWYIYEDFLFAYKTIYKSFPREVRHEVQLWESSKKHFNNLLTINSKIEQYSRTNDTFNYEWYYSLPRYIEPKLSLRAISLFSLSRKSYNLFFQAEGADLSKPQSYEDNTMIDSYFLWSIIPTDDLKKTRVALLNLMLIIMQFDKKIYWSYVLSLMRSGGT